MSTTGSGSVGVVGVVGAGIVGLAIARRVQQVRPGTRVVVFDKETQVAAHQTGHNSGVVHSGLYYTPGSLRARLCRRGTALLRDHCSAHDIAFDEVGKVVVATRSGELDALAELHRRGTANGVPGLHLIGPDELRELEPAAVGLRALHSPTTAIVDYAAVARSLGDDLLADGGEVRLGAEVTGVSAAGDRVCVRTARDEVTVDRLVVCAGLQTDRVAAMAGDDAEPRIVPFRGEYYRLPDERTGLVRGLIYPVPDPRFPFLGIHLTRRVDGHVDVGPNAVWALAREGYRRRDVRPGDVLDAVGQGGFRRLARRNVRAGAYELAGSMLRRVYLARARRYVPDLRLADLRPAPAGVRAQALDPDGSLIEDFRISERGPVLALRNAPSPAATSALAIAEHVVERLLASPT